MVVWVAFFLACEDLGKISDHSFPAGALKKDGKKVEIVHTH